MKEGDFIRIDYVGRVESGEIFDLTDGALAKKEDIYNPNTPYKPIPVIIGAGFVIKGLDKELEKMKVGEKKKVIVPPEEGFGKRDPKLIKVVNKKMFKDQPKVGMIINVQGAIGRIQSIDGGRVRIDFNNPLSGKKLEYEIEVKEEITGVSEKISAVMEFFGNSSSDVSVNAGTAEISGVRMSPDMKKRVSEIIKKYVSEVKSIRFVEEY